MDHDLKTINPYFMDVMSHKKDFEIRLNDRNFQVGDCINLMEYVRGKYTGVNIRRRIKYILPLAELMTIQKADFWSKTDIDKYGIVILGLETAF